MARFSKYGWVNRRNPEAAAVCDRGGEVRKRSELQKEMIWAGRKLVWNGMLCCRYHIDQPHPQDQFFVVPPDPVPVRNPRPPLPMTTLAGYVTADSADPFEAAEYVTDWFGRPITDTE